MRALAFFGLALASVLMIGALTFPNHVRALAPSDLARIVYLLAAALFVGFGAFGIRRDAKTSLARRFGHVLIWIVIFVAVMLGYQLVQDFRQGLNVLH